MTQALIGGYRLLRRLGEGRHAVVLLAHPEGDAEAAPVAMKTYHAEIAAELPLREAAMLSRGAGEHVVRLLDVASTAEGGHALVLERLSGGSVAQLLAQRQHLAPGEAITLLAPIAQTVLRLHQAGVVHGGISAEAAHLDALGTPVLLGFGSARPIEPGCSPARLAEAPGAVQDVHDMYGLAAQVLARLPDTAAVRALSAPPDPAADAHEGLRHWIGELFDLAEPLPIHTAEQPPEIGEALPARLPLAETAVPVDVPLSLSLGLPEWLDQPIRSGVDHVKGLLGTVRGRLGAVRARVWIPAALVALALLVALVMAPAGESDAAPGPAHASSEATPTPVSSQPEDPVRAAAALLALRERCLRERSVLCLDGVGQPGSAALAEDQRLVRELQSGGEVPPDWVLDPSGFHLLERLGDSALIALGDVPETQPASLLLMQGEAGWRIRGYLQQ